MRELNAEEVEIVSGGLIMAPGSAGGWFLSWLGGEALSWAIGQAASGNVDYAGLVEQNGSNYNMLGA